MRAGHFARVCCAGLSFALVWPSSATMQGPTFKVASRTVAVYATVANVDGRLVPDLPRSAFTILDNGKPQTLTVFSNDTQPITAVLLLDRSGSMLANFALVEKAAESFVNAMLPTDKARIGSFANGVEIDPIDFTSDHDRLLRILRTDLQPEGPTPLWNAVDIGIRALVREQGRRVILVFTDGGDNPGNLRSDNSSLRDVMTRAEEQDVMVYAIGFEGRSGAMMPSGRGPGGAPGRGGRGGGGAPTGGRVEKPDAGLPKIATATGGGYFELTSTDDLGSTFGRVADELHHQYALGFTPAALDGKRHTLDVQVAGTALTVRARKSYLAVDDAAPPPTTTRAVSGEALEGALSSLARGSDTRAIRTWIGQSRGMRGRTTVTFVWEAAPKVPGAAVEAEPPARVLLVASGPNAVEYFNNTIPAADVSGTGDTPLVATFDVDPGPVQLHLSVEDASSHRIASETRTITVVDLDAHHTVLGTPEILRARTLPLYQLMKANLDATPAVTREFTRSDRLIVRVPAYGVDGVDKVVGMRLLNQSGFVTKELVVTPMAARSLQQADVPVANLAPGEYVIQIQVVGDGEAPAELVAFRLGS